MKYLTDFRKTVETGMDPRPNLSFPKKHSLRKHPFLLTLRRWGRFTRRNVCDSATEIPY